MRDCAHAHVRIVWLREPQTNKKTKNVLFVLLLLLLVLHTPNKCDNSTLPCVAPRVNRFNYHQLCFSQVAVQCKYMHDCTPLWTVPFVGGATHQQQLRRINKYTNTPNKKKTPPHWRRVLLFGKTHTHEHEHARKTGFGVCERTLLHIFIYNLIMCMARECVYENSRTSALAAVCARVCWHARIIMCMCYRVC